MSLVDSPIAIGNALAQDRERCREGTQTNKKQNAKRKTNPKKEKEKAKAKDTKHANTKANKQHKTHRKKWSHAKGQRKSKSANNAPIAKRQRQNRKKKSESTAKSTAANQQTAKAMPMAMLKAPSHSQRISSESESAALPFVSDRIPDAPPNAHALRCVRAYRHTNRLIDRPTDRPFGPSHGSAEQWTGRPVVWSAEAPAMGAVTSVSVADRVPVGECIRCLLRRRRRSWSLVWVVVARHVCCFSRFVSFPFPFPFVRL